MKYFKIAVFTIIAVWISTSSFAESQWLKKLGAMANTQMDAAKNVSLSDTKIGEGLKEALKVGIDNAVQITGKTDGFFANDLIKIKMPQKLQIIEKPLRVMGFGKQIDEFILSMNRAAEKAAPSARDIFIDAIMKITISDVQGLYKGGPSAATDFLKSKTYNKLKGQFSPLVAKALKDYQVTKKYQDIVGRYEQIAFSQKFPAPSIEDYVVTKSLDGLFVVLAQEEAKIRKDPAARTTSLLKEIFK
jgi:hypothetical protein